MKVWVNIMIDKVYGDAFYEVLEILKNVPIEDYMKIPSSFIETLNLNYNEKCEFQYNQALSFNKQNISKEAKAILAIICEKFWNYEFDNYEGKDNNLRLIIRNNSIDRKNKLIELIEKIKKLFQL